ncbi:MAG: hypothetical protein ACI4LA_05355 [Emergencia sp.]
MKHRITTLLAAITLIAAMTSSVLADTELTNRQVEKEYFPDGSYAVIETVTEQQSGIILFATETTKKAHTTYTYYNASNIKAWDFTLDGTFSYNGTTAKAAAASTSYNIYVSGWKCSNRKAWTTGATAKGSATFTYNSLMSKDVTLGLKCSANGTITAV